MGGERGAPITQVVHQCEQVVDQVLVAIVAESGPVAAPGRLAVGNTAEMLAKQRHGQDRRLVAVAPAVNEDERRVGGIAPGGVAATITGQIDLRVLRQDLPAS